MRTIKARRATQETVAAAPERKLRLATGADADAGSAVPLLQNYIEAEFGELAEPVGPQPWPRAISMPLTAAVALGLWWGLIVGARALFRF